MSRNKRGSGAADMFQTHLFGAPFAQNNATTRTAIIERMYLRLLAELATNRFKWTGLPESIDVRFLETTLFYQALSVFYYDNDLDAYLALRGSSTTFVNMQNNPTAFTTVGNEYVSKNLSAYIPFKDYSEDEAKRKAIPIWSNYLRMPDWDIVRVYANRLAELDRTIEVNSRNARKNRVVFTSDNTRLSFVNINRQIDEADNFIQISADGPLQDMSAIQTVDMGIKVDEIEKLHIVRTRMWNECMGLMGINNANQDKKERLVASEVDANDDQTSMMRYVNLNARQSAVKQINKVHELNISVTYYTDEPVEPPEVGAGAPSDADDTDEETE